MDVRAAKKLKYGAERLGQERGWKERQNERMSHHFQRNMYHDRYQIEKIPLNAYHCKYGISEILSESVSLYTLKRRFNPDITHCTHTSRIGASSMALYHRTTVKTRKKLRFRWQASQKCTFLLFSGVPEPHMPPSGGRMSGDDNVVTAAKVDSRQHCRITKLSKEGLLSKQNTICTLK